MTTLSQRDLEMLMAYADGELDREDAAEAEAMMAADPEARAAVARFLTDGPVLRQAFGVEEAPTAEVAPITDSAGRDIRALQAELHDELAARRNRKQVTADKRSRGGRGGGGFSVGFPAIAASLALLVSGVAAGFLAGQSTGSQDAQALTTAVLAELADTQREALTAALEQSPNGETRTWQAADGTAGGSITPTVTYVAEDGAFCREVETTADVLGQTHDAVGIACREDGRWRVRYWVIENPDTVAGMGL